MALVMKFYSIFKHLSNMGLANGSLNGPNADITDSKHSNKGNIVLLLSSVSIHFLFRMGINCDSISSFLMFAPKD